MKVRYYGFMHPSCAVALEQLREIIGQALGIKVKIDTCKAESLSEPVCKHCGGTLIFQFFIPPLPVSMQGLPAG